MKFNILITMLSFATVLQAQDFSSYIRENAIAITAPDSLNNRVYNLVSKYNVIMVGEMHGTNEPSRLAEGLVKLLTEHGDSVQIGFEIPPEDMNLFLQERTDSHVYHSTFFTQMSEDGRACLAWANAIASANKNPKARIFFYDINRNESSDSNYDDRDSLMYAKVKREIMQHPHWKTITLSGNVHNMLQPFNGEPKMAYFLAHDSMITRTTKICSLNHWYYEGTMLNNIGKGLQLRSTGSIESEYSSATQFSNYILLYPENTLDSYNGIFFTRKVSASTLVRRK